ATTDRPVRRGGESNHSILGTPDRAPGYRAGSGSDEPAGVPGAEGAQPDLRRNTLRPECSTSELCTGPVFGGASSLRCSRSAFFSSAARIFALASAIGSSDFSDDISAPVFGSAPAPQHPVPWHHCARRRPDTPVNICREGAQATGRAWMQVNPPAGRASLERRPEEVIRPAARRRNRSLGASGLCTTAGTMPAPATISPATL